MRYSRKISFCGQFIVSIACISAEKTAFGQAALTSPDQSVANQNGGSLTTSPANATASQQYSSSFIDPRNGIIYDRYIELENVPTYKNVTEQKMERRWVPEIQTKTMPVTQTEYVPTVSYTLQPVTPNLLRPLAQPQYQYVQRVDYIPVNKVVSMPVSVQQYVEKEIPVQVQKTVETTTSVRKYVDRARAGQSLANAAPNYPTTPIAPYAGYANVVPGSLPTYPLASSPTIAPTTNYQYAAPYAGIAAQTSPGVAPLVPIQNASTPPYNAVAAGPSPWNKFTNWVSGNGPLFSTSAFRQNQLLPTNTYGSNPSLAAVGSPSVGFGGPVSYAYQPTAPYQSLASGSTTSILPNQSAILPGNQTAILPNNSSAVMPPQQPAGRMTIIPSASSNSSRTATQTGMPATEFR